MTKDWVDEIDEMRIIYTAQQFEHLYDNVRKHVRTDLIAGFITLLLWYSEREDQEQDGAIEHEENKEYSRK